MVNDTLFRTIWGGHPRVKGARMRVDLNQDAPRVRPDRPPAFQPLPETGGLNEDLLLRNARDGNPNVREVAGAPGTGGAQLTARLADATINAPQGSSIGDIPLTALRVRGVATSDSTDAIGTVTRAGDPIYEETPRSLDELYQEVGTRMGVRPGFLRDLARKESREDISARPIDPDTGLPDMRGAYGLTQFVRSTWDDVTASHGPALGYVRPESDDEHYDRRADPRWALAFGATLADENAQALQRITGSRPSEGDVYLAHFVGSDVAGALIRADRSYRGSLPAASFVSPQAARNNRSVFFDRDGRPRSVHEVITRQEEGFSSRPWVRTRANSGGASGDPSLSE